MTYITKENVTDGIPNDKFKSEYYSKHGILPTHVCIATYEDGSEHLLIRSKFVYSGNSKL